ncbi:MAG: AAA family ATPase [Archangium sp.]|nr:AAA family ATPase [Archangium sp.]
MSKNDSLRIDRLTLRNFRCFKTCNLALHPQLTVLVAENGRGKTAILDALGIALGPFVDAVSGIPQSAGISRSDIRRVRNDEGTMVSSAETTVEATGWVDGHSLGWSRSLNGTVPKGRTSRKDLKVLESTGADLRGRLEQYSLTTRDLPPPLPLVAFYGTGRLWTEHRLTQAKRAHGSSPMGRLSGYLDSLSWASSFNAFVNWYESTSDLARSPTSLASAEGERPTRLLAAVRKAVDKVLTPTGWRGIDWDFTTRELVAEHHEHGRLSVSLLSDGVRNMISLVADLAHRCVRLNPHFGENAPEFTPGVLLVDEIDMHLHPRWQQMAVGLIQQTFPQMQMVLTTHSPHTLSAINAESIRLLRTDKDSADIRLPAFQTRGMESSDALALVMGVDPTPNVPEASWLAEYRATLQSGTQSSEAGSELWKKILEHFGEDHPASMQVAALRRLHEFQRDTPSGES